MRKNIRRSLMVAAAASGVCALSTTGASAAELPAHSDASSTVDDAVEEADIAGDPGKGTVAETVRGAADTVQSANGTVEDVTRGVTGKLPSKGIPENGLPTNTLPTGGLPGGAAGGVPVEALPPAARGAGMQARPMAYQSATDVAVTADAATAATADTAPFAERTYVRAQEFAHGAAGDDLGDFGGGVASDAVPYAHELGTGVHGNANELGRHAVTDVRILVTAPGKRDLSDPTNVPGQAPAGR